MTTQDIDWTLEAGTEDAPVSIDVVILYNYRYATPDSYWQPGDPPEADFGVPWFVDDGCRIEVAILEPEWSRIEQYVMENPPEPWEPDYD